MFTKLCIHYHCLRVFLLTSKRNLLSIISYSPLSALHHPWQPLIYFLSHRFVLYTSCKWNHTVSVLLHQVSFPQRNIFKVHKDHSMYQYFIPFHGSIIFHSWVHHLLFISSSINGYLGCFDILAITNSAAMKTSPTSSCVDFFQFS